MAATVTAIAAVVIAIWDNVQTRKFNQLSVLPHVVLDRVQHDSAGVTRGEITFSNEGVGPAILHRLEIRLPSADGGDAVMTKWGDAAPLLRHRGLQIRGWMDVDSGNAIGVQRSGTLLRLQAEGEGAPQRLQSALDDLRLRLRYSSVYGDVFASTLGTWPAQSSVP